MPFILIEILFWERNDKKSKKCFQKFYEFTNNKLKISIKRIRRKETRSRWQLKHLCAKPSSTVKVPIADTCGS